VPDPKERVRHSVSRARDVKDTRNARRTREPPARSDVAKKWLTQKKGSGTRPR